MVYTNVCNECQCHDTSIKGNIVGRQPGGAGVLDGGSRKLSSAKRSKNVEMYLGGRVPTLCAFLGLKKITFCDISVIGTVVKYSTNVRDQKSHKWGNI